MDKATEMKTKYAINHAFGGIEVWADCGYGWQWVRTFSMM